MTSDSPWTPAAPDDAPAPPRRRRPLLTVAVALFVVGALFTVAAAITPFVLGRDAPSWLYLGAMAFTPVGFLLALVSLVVGARPGHGPRPDRDPNR